MTEVEILMSGRCEDGMIALVAIPVEGVILEDAIAVHEVIEHGITVGEAAEVEFLVGKISIDGGMLKGGIGDSGIGDGGVVKVEDGTCETRVTGEDEKLMEG